MDNSELVGELLKALSDDLKELQAKVEKLPTKAPVDYRDSVEELTKSVQHLQQLWSQPPAVPAASAVDPSAIIARFDRLEQISRQRPEYKMSQYVQYGAYAFGLMVVLLVGMSWLAFEWRSEREEYAQAYTQTNWRVRYIHQADPGFYGHIEDLFRKDFAGVQQWTLEQEQADEKRAIAREAAEQAKAMNAQADQLEGKASTKGMKRERQ